MEKRLIDPSSTDLMNILGALTFALCAQMTDLERSKFAKNLRDMARRAEADGMLGVMSGLQQLVGAAGLTPP